VYDLTNPAVPVMMFVFVLLSIGTVVIPLITDARAMRWVTVVVAFLLAAMNALDGGFHILRDGDIINGLYTLLISGGVGLMGAILAVKWAQRP
jgi:hypothetical protein